MQDRVCSPKVLHDASKPGAINQGKRSAGEGVEDPFQAKHPAPRSQTQVRLHQVTGCRPRGGRPPHPLRSPSVAATVERDLQSDADHQAQ